MTSLSVIIPTRDEPRVADAVASVVRQDGARDLGEILVVGSDAQGAVPRHPLVRFLDNRPTVLASANRNRGIAEAQGEWLLFLDADCIARPGWLNALAGALATRPAVSAVTGAVVLRGDDYWATAYNVTSFHAYRAGLPAGPRAHIPTLTMGVTRAACQATGPLDAAYDPCEDMEWTIRMAAAGVALTFIPEAQVEHRPRANVATLWRKSFSNGARSAAIRRRYPRVSYGLNWGGILTRPWLLRLLSPAVGLATTATIFRAPAMWRYLHTAPLVWLTKLAWCWGAARY